MSRQTTADRLLDTAEALIRERGYNAFSYSDLADAVGIRKASIHYHFPSKADLGVAVMKRYLDELDEALARIDSEEPSSTQRLERFVQIYKETESAQALCLCGSLASDLATLAPQLQSVVENYLSRSRDWVRSRVEEGVDAGELRLRGTSEDAAIALLSALQGGLILSRAMGRRSQLDAVQRAWFSSLCSD